MTFKSKTWIGPFKILNVIGEGATGIVYVAEDPSLGRKVAIKLLKSKYKYSEELRQRFLREARNMAKLAGSENVVTVFAVGDEEGLPYMVMEYVKGKDLFTFTDEKTLNPKQILNFFLETTNGLHYASTNGIIHRDVKPANIFITDNQHAKIGDFGLAREMAVDSELTADGILVGTPDYLAPEVITGKKPSEKSDIYALGCTFYNIIENHPPFRKEEENISAGEVLSRHLTSKPFSIKNKTISFSVKKLIMLMISKDPQKRPDYDQIKNVLNSEYKKVSSTETNSNADETNDDFPFNPFIIVFVSILFSTLILFLGIKILN